MSTLFLAGCRASGGAGRSFDDDDGSKLGPPRWFDFCFRYRSVDLSSPASS